MTDNAAPAGPPGPVADLEEWLGDQHPEPPEHAASFRIDSDELATWAFRKRRSHALELERLRGLAAAERERIDLWEADATAGARGRLAWFDQALGDYYRLLHDADPDLPKTYRVPGGTLARRKNPDSLEVCAETEAVAWLMDNRTELVRLAPDKAAIKKALAVPGLEDAYPGQRLELVDPLTGEVVPGLVHLVGEVRVDVTPEREA